MISRNVSLWQRLRGNFAFLPAAALGCGVLAGVLMLLLDAQLVDAVPWPEALLASPEIARSALTAIATSSLTIAALAVSLTLAVLTHAGAQFSPRVLKTFLSDGVSQASIGLLLGVHAYCLVVMRGIGSAGEVPHLAVALGVLSGFASVALLIYYLHHLASSLRASHVVAAIAAETGALLDAMDKDAGRPRELGEWPPMPGPAAQRVKAPRSGYLQSVDVGRLDGLARDCNAFVSIEVQLGSFLGDGECLATIWPPEAGEQLKSAVRSAAQIGDHPECEQDPYCGMSQLVDLALRALSPSLNDPHSAGLAVDRLGELLVRALGIERMRGEHLAARGGEGRVRIRQRSAAELLASCFDPLRQNAAGQCLLLDRLLSALRRIADRLPCDAPLDEALQQQVDALERAVASDVSEPLDARRLQCGLSALRERLQARRQQAGQGAETAQEGG